ncbi:histidine-rich glycoprotein-like, partial [Mytilus trossulus]|uniref:histidine-rich glycoprotein-like n=1 Tax=Mytilus trossulus TaxID=6551 RepID=UPI003004833E
TGFGGHHHAHHHRHVVRHTRVHHRLIGLAYHKRYHGFKITHGRFAYKGLGYKLTCGKSRFYRLWRSCYSRYHSRGRCFGRFRKQHLFAVYKGHGHVVSHRHGLGHGHVVIHGHVHYIRHRHGHGYSHGHGHGYSHGHGHVYSHGHGHGHRHGHIHRTSYYSYYKKNHGFRIHHHWFSYGGRVNRLTCHRNRFYSLWNNCYTHHHSRSYCFGHLRKQHLFVSYHGDGHGHIYHDHKMPHHKRHQYRHNLLLHKKIANHHVNRIHNVANNHVSKIAHISYKHVQNIGFQANKHVSRIENEAGRHIDRFRKLVKFHMNRLHNHAKDHLSAVEHQHERHLSERQYQNTQHLSNEEHLHNKHEHHISKLHSILGHGYGDGHVVSYLDYYNKYHGFPIADNRFTYDGIAYKLKCESSRFYSLWSNCWSQYHSRRVCFGNLRKQNLFIDYPGDYADEYSPTKIEVKTGGDFDYKK